MAVRDQRWFEMADIRKRLIVDAVWIPLRVSERQSVGESGTVGCEKEYYGVSSVAFPLKNRELSKKLDWSRMGLGFHRHCAFAFEDGTYKPAEVFQEPEGTDLGVELVLEQDFDGADDNVWHLNQDLVIALGLLQEGDVWLRPHEGYLDVARMARDARGSAVRVEIRAEHLRDYLAARGMFLRLVTFRARDAIMEEASALKWPKGGVREEKADERFETRISAIHEGGGGPFGSETAVFHVGRSDVDPEADIPRFDAATDENTVRDSWRTKSKGRKVFRVSGELWRDEMIEPAKSSPRVRNDKVPAISFFITDAAGTRMSADDLKDEGTSRWLWFKPEVVNAVLKGRGASLEWYTLETGKLQSLQGYPIHFGVNSKDLVTAYASDVARLPEWQRQIWAGYNVAPDGKVSPELLSAQMEARPAETAPPEGLFRLAMQEADEACEKKWGARLFTAHVEHGRILEKIHRFRALDRSGLFELAKDVARVTADSINADPLRAVAGVVKGEKQLGSLKSLEKAVATIVSAEDARKRTGPLFAAYDLRLADAHLPSASVEKAFELLGFQQEWSWMRKGMQLIMMVAYSLHFLAETVVGPTGSPPSP